MIVKLNCPACAAEIKFKSSISVFGVCSFCQSMVVRRDMNLENLGKMAELPSDSSPLQIGTRGSYRGKQFELVGRLKLSWENGYWNEWFALFSDGREGWVADAQGFYMVSFRVDNFRSVPEVKNIIAGQNLSLGNDQNFQVDDIKQATCIGSEGELPIKGPKGRKTTSIDLIGPDSQFACIEYSNDGVRLYIGEYVDFDELALTYLREIDGW